MGLTTVYDNTDGMNISKNAQNNRDVILHIFDIVQDS